MIKGYGTGKNAVEGTGGGFAFYKLGETVFNDDGYLNETVGTEKLRQYIWYTETRTALIRNESSEDGATYANYFLGEHIGAAYYFYYEPGRVTTLDKAFLNTITKRAEQYIIYADNCLLTEDFMRVNHIIFKKIPRDVRKF